MRKTFNYLMSYTLDYYSDSKKERGASMVEYALLVAFIAIIALVGVKVLGVNLNAIFTDVAGELE